MTQKLLSVHGVPSKRHAVSTNAMSCLSLGLPYVFLQLIRLAGVSPDMCPFDRSDHRHCLPGPKVGEILAPNP